MFDCLLVILDWSVVMLDRTAFMLDSFLVIFGNSNVSLDNIVVTSGDCGGPGVVVGVVGSVGCVVVVGFVVVVAVVVVVVVIDVVVVVAVVVTVVGGWVTGSLLCSEN